MLSLKSGRRPSFQRAVAGLVGGLLGVLWTVFAVAITADAVFPLMKVILPLFGVLVTLLAWGSAMHQFINAASQQRFAEYEFLSSQEELELLQAKFDAKTASSPAARSCLGCGAPLQKEFRFCPQCGKEIG
jgi:hypothetical protein